jgi:error-prone DNA polymerase
LWQAELAVRRSGELLETAAVDTSTSPLAPMTPGQRTCADFSNSGLTIGRHPMSFHRARMREMGVLDSTTAKLQKDGTVMKVAGCVITRQRPGTAKGFVFLSLEDEAGIINIIVRPDLFDRKRVICTTSPYLLIKGVLQSQMGVISLKAGEIEDLSFHDSAVMRSHDFH